MAITLRDLLHEEHILLNLEADDARQAIQELNQALVASNYTQDAFAEDVWQREQTYPTGLPTQPVPVAIPHADPDHVNASAVSIGVLRQPVKFAQMGTDGSIQLETPIVILLAVKEREKQVALIQELMRVIQSPQLLEALLRAASPQEARQLIETALKEG